MTSSKQKPKGIKFNADDFTISAKRPLGKFSTQIPDLYSSKDEAKDQLSKLQDKLSDFQETLYADGSQALLIILQGMDTAGKDGLVKHVMSGINPQGVQIASFKAPTPAELKHDFLWRTHLAVPARGDIGIFNRSYYEEIVVTRVHPEMIAHENLPTPIREKFWRNRMKDIRHFEEYLQREGVRVLKLFLHISKEEQKERLEARIANPKKHWKFDAGDVVERGYWKQYQAAYSDALKHTSTKESPWYVLPADDKLSARLMASTIILETMEDMHIHHPKTRREQVKAIQKAKKLLKQ